MSTDWTPPFCATETSLDCPACGAKDSICVREESTYTDSSDYPGFCSECHATLDVYASVSIEFTEAEVRR